MNLCPIDEEARRALPTYDDTPASVEAVRDRASRRAPHFWAKLPHGTVRHLFKPHPFNSDYVWSPCGQLCGKDYVTTTMEPVHCTPCMLAFRKCRLDRDPRKQEQT